MNHITQATWNTRLSNNPKSPTLTRILSSEDVKTPTLPHCGSWRTKMFAKMKECRNAIMNMMTFDKLSNPIETARTSNKSPSNSSMLRATTSVSSIPDIISFNHILLKHKEYGDEVILLRNSTLNSDEEQLNTSTEQPDNANDANDSLNHVVSEDNTMNSSLKSFLALEKQVNEEFTNDETMFTIKKKISAEPFLSYAEGTAEFVWTEDTTEESFPGIAWSSLERLNSSEIGFEKPRNNSTFYESYPINKNRTSSPIKNIRFQDSGFENNFSV